MLSILGFHSSFIKIERLKSLLSFFLRQAMPAAKIKIAPEENVTNPNLPQRRPYEIPNIQPEKSGSG
ncbi:MAG TPA: hypothetical protein VF692_02685 [Pyrinomonadaceae bacterium]